MKKKRAWIWVGIITGPVIVFILGGFVFNRTVPDVATQLGSLKPAIMVTISEPFNGQQVSPENTISVFVNVDSSQELQSVQVYADGMPLSLLMSSPLVQSPVTTWFVWSPGAEGWHVLVARATDRDGFTAISNPVRVEAALSPSLPPGAPPAEITTLDMPMTIMGISSDSPDFEPEFDAEVERLLTQWEGSQPFQLQVPSFPAPDEEVPPEPLPGSLLETPARASSLQKFRLWAAGITGTPTSLPRAPTLRGSVEECSVRLQVEDRAEDELGFRLYRLGPLDSAWVLAADLQASDGTGVFETVDPDRNAGRHSYYIASYNAGGENPGNLLDLDVTAEACSIHSPRAISLQNAILTPALPVDRLYCYASQDGSNWERIPRNAQEFVYPVEGAFDLSPQLRAVGSPGTALNLTLDCWGWQGGSLVSLGRGVARIGTGAGPLEFDAERYHFRADSVQDPIRPGDHFPTLLTIVPPVNLHNPGSLADCDVFSGDDAAMEWACENLIDPLTGEPTSGHSILVWHYYDFCKYDEKYCEGYLPWDEVQGYHVYRQTKNSLGQWNEPILIRTVERYDLLMAVLSPGETTSASLNTRYFVRAFVSDGYESADSNYVQAVPANFRMTIPALYLQNISVMVFKPGKQARADHMDEELVEQTGDGFLVGYFRSHAKHLPKSTSFIFDAWVQFDLSQVPGTITDATLSWDGDLEISASGWDKAGIFCGNQFTTYYGWPVDYVNYLLPSMDVDVTNYVFLQQQAAASNSPMGGMDPNFFGFYILSGLRTHYTTEYFLDGCTARIKDVHLEVEYTK